MVALRRVVALIGFLSVSGVASAHDVTTKFEAPIPLSLLFAGAGSTVALTALYLVVSDHSEASRSSSHRFVVPQSVAEGGRVVASVGFLLAFAWSLFAGATGTTAAAENPATVFVWALWLKGVAVLAVLVGDPWPTLSPWRTVYEGLVRLEGDELALTEYPDWFGEWPALVGFLAVVGVLENLTVVPNSPSATAGLLAAYAVVMVLGAVVFGREWLRRADFFAVLYRLFGRVAPVERRDVSGGLAISLRSPWRACRTPVESFALASFVVAAVYTVSFDGFANAPEYQTLLFAVRDATGVGPVVSAVLYVLGFLGFLAAFLGVVALTRRFGTSERFESAALALAPTILPIAVAYELAHNAAFVLTRLGDFLAILGGPDVALLAWLSLPVFWTTQVLLVVAGHVVAVVAAHSVVRKRVAGSAGSRSVKVGYAHAPLTVLMVGYTVLSLWIISRPW
ncbi:hypothetical protein [Halorussus halophilus]|uniref:hypothetical protein n=1 Tax=Halorussus halophilus TaxID=2650975 RepID=UPI001300E171|nr:hypothetical protein [Halorussus halophilus]